MVPGAGMCEVHHTTALLQPPKQTFESKPNRTVFYCRTVAVVELHDWIQNFNVMQQLLQHVTRMDAWLGSVGRKMQVRVIVV
jgi:hypothetical protein